MLSYLAVLSSSSPSSTSFASYFRSNWCVSFSESKKKENSFSLFVGKSISKELAQFSQFFVSTECRHQFGVFGNLLPENVIQCDRIHLAWCDTHTRAFGAAATEEEDATRKRIYLFIFGRAETIFDSFLFGVVSSAFRHSNERQGERKRENNFQRFRTRHGTQTTPSSSSHRIVATAITKVLKMLRKIEDKKMEQNKRVGDNVPNGKTCKYRTRESNDERCETPPWSVWNGEKPNFDDEKVCHKFSFVLCWMFYFSCNVSSMCFFFAALSRRSPRLSRPAPVLCRSAHNFLVRMWVTQKALWRGRWRENEL